MKALSVTAITAAALLAGCSQQPVEAPLDGAWTLDAERSSLSFVSVKAAQVAEVHGFSGLQGAVGADGEASLQIDLATVETNIDIRNERMRDILFEVAEFPEAQVTLSLDPAQFAGLSEGEAMAVSVEATMDLHGASGTVPADLVVTRIADDLVKVETARPVVIAAATYGLAEGLEELATIAGLDSITAQVPVSASLVFARQTAD